MRPQQACRAIALIALAACSTRAPARNTPDAPAAATPVTPAPPLAAADLDTIAELIRLEDRREFDATRFNAWLALPHPEMRSRAAVGIGRIGDRAGTQLILRTLSDTSVLVRKNGAFALGELGDTSALVVQGLAHAARQADSVGVEAIAALAKLGTAAAYTTIETLLIDPAAAPELRREALLSLWRFARKPNTLELILPFAASSSAETRWRAVYVMTRGSADPRALPHILKWVTDADPAVRAVAVRGLRATTVDSAGQRPQARVALLAALRDPHPHVRINAVRALGGFREAGSLPYMIPLLTDMDGNVALAAAESLGDNGGAEAELAAFARGKGHLGVRMAALNALLRTADGRASAFQLARQLVQSTNPVERLLAARVLLNSANPSALEQARQLLADPDGRIAALALGTIVSADTVSPPRALFVQQLAHADPAVRAAALRGLQRGASAADLELFLNAYDRAQQDTQRYASQAAVDALSALMRMGVPVERSFFLRFRKPSDPLLRERIAQRIGPGDWGATRPIDTGRDQQFYRTAARTFFGRDSTAAHPRVRIRTAAGEFVIQLNGREAPLTVQSFIELANRGYFNNGRWHRVVPNFVLQDGDPRGDGSGGPGRVLRDEINRLRYTRGALGMALSGPDTGGSQFFVAHSPQPHLDGGYTVFGQVISGMDVADRVIQEDPIISIEVIR